MPRGSLDCRRCGLSDAAPCVVFWRRPLIIGHTHFISPFPLAFPPVLVGRTQEVAPEPRQAPAARRPSPRHEALGLVALERGMEAAGAMEVDGTMEEDKPSCDCDEFGEFLARFVAGDEADTFDDEDLMLCSNASPTYSGLLDDICAEVLGQEGLGAAMPPQQDPLGQSGITIGNNGSTGIGGGDSISGRSGGSTLGGSTVTVGTPSRLLAPTSSAASSERLAIPCTSTPSVVGERSGIPHIGCQESASNSAQLAGQAPPASTGELYSFKHVPAHVVLLTASIHKLAAGQHAAAAALAAAAHAAACGARRAHSESAQHAQYGFRLLLNKKVGIVTGWTGPIVVLQLLNDCYAVVPAYCPGCGMEPYSEEDLASKYLTSSGAPAKDDPAGGWGCAIAAIVATAVG